MERGVASTSDTDFAMVHAQIEQLRMGLELWLGAALRDFIMFTFMYNINLLLVWVVQTVIPPPMHMIIIVC